MTSTRPKRKRYLRMTGTQIGILAGMGVLVITIFGVGLALILSDSNQSSTVAQLSSEQQKATISSAAAATIAARPIETIRPFPTSTPEIQFPPTWTLTPSPTATRRPQYTPTELSVKPTSTIDSICTAIKKWSSSSLQNIQEKADIMKAFLSQDPNHVDFHFVRALADRMTVVAKSQSKIQVPRELADMNLLFVSGFELMGQSMSEAALGLETANYSLINQSYSTADQANVVIDRATEKWKSVAQKCGLDISKLI